MREPHDTDKLRQYVALLSRGVVRAVEPAADLALAEPAEPTFDPPPDKADWRDFAVGDAWGAANQWAYLRGRVSAAAKWKGGAVELRLALAPRYLDDPRDDFFPAGPEGLVFIDGRALGAIDQQHDALRIALKPGRSADVRAVFFAGRCRCRHTLARFELTWIDTAAEKLYHDLRVALDVALLHEPSSVMRARLLDAVAAAVALLDTRGIDTGAAPQADASPHAAQPLRASVADAQAAFDEMLKRVLPAGEAPHVATIGHGHLDLAWLWPASIARHKAARTVATQLRLLDQHPSWVFTQASPQLYADLADDAPALFDRIEQQIDAGRWEATGAMWVEADTNLPSGESLVRQLLYGVRYLRTKLGADGAILWLPDSFGFSATLPQLMNQAGVKALVTSKMSWSRTNQLPHDAFRWRGIDGSEALVQFVTTPDDRPHRRGAKLESTMTAAELRGAWDAYKQKHLLTEALMTFGHGDGGGGPTEFMLETAQRLATMPKSDRMPRAVLTSAAAMIERLAERRDDLPVWDGEMYLELHQGAYTSQAWLKRANRKNELALRDAEWLAAAAHLFAVEGAAADANAQRFAELWRDLLTAQFHDILPGTCVGEVYDSEVRPMHQRLAQQAAALIDDVAALIGKRLDTARMAKPIALFNTLSFARREPVQIASGKWLEAVDVPAGGWTVVDADATHRRDDPAVLAVSEDGRTLTNYWWRLRLDDAGRVASLRDAAHSRELLRPDEPANVWQLFEDRPLAYDAWDIDAADLARPLRPPALEGIRIVERGPARAAVELRWSLPAPDGQKDRASAITQRIVMYADLPRIDFETTVDWRAHHQLLKVAWPVDVRADSATYDIQFGHIRRPTHRNTSWDAARYECCAHRFVDLADASGGVAMLNDCKYGHDVRDHVIRLTCIKAAQSPHGQADQGRHRFTYSILPHTGSWQDAGVARAAAALNSPIIAVPLTPGKGDLPAESPLIESDHDAVVIETLKPAEDGKGIVLRLYESHGGRATAKLTLARPPRLVQHLDLHELPTPEACALQHEDNTISLTLHPFQIVTLRLRF